MKKVTIDLEEKYLIRIAEELGVQYKSLTKEELVHEINQTISKNRKDINKWYVKPGAYPYKKNQITVINTNHENHRLHGRLFMVTSPSIKKNTVKGFIINELKRKPQKTITLIEMSKLNIIDKEIKVNNS